MPSSSALAAAQYLLGRGFLDSLAAGHNRALRIPVRIDLIGRECGSTNGGYLHDSHTVIICFELVEAIRNEWG